MIYENLNINKKYIKLKDIKMPFEKNGIYIIKGDNGSGKTTLIENLVFDEDILHFVFSNENESETFKSNKESLFTYISQKTAYSEDNVEKYIKKLNNKIRIDEITYYLDLFELPRDILKSKFCYLSGGEQKKIVIISALLKRTPYIFMDEPTNYMDDKSVEILITVLKQEEKNKKIIIVTHDPRLSEINKNIFLLEDSTIKEVINNEADENNDNATCDSKITSPGFIKFFFGEIKNFAFGITCLVFSLILINLLLYTNTSYKYSIGEETGKYHDSILAYNVGEGHDTLNEVYEKAENIKVDETEYDKYINYDEIVNIADVENVKEVYLPDTEYIYELEDILENGKMDTMVIYACPNAYIEQYGETFGDKFGLEYTEGRLPKDNMKEVAISKNLLEKSYGYNKDSVEKAIGDSITIGDSAYTIVGYSYYDMAIISYDKNENYGFYCYQKDTYEDFYNRQMNFISKIDGGDDIDDILITVDEKYEKSVLDTLIEKYPSNCFISQKFEEIYYKQQKIDIFKKWFLINCLFSAFFSIVIWFIVNKSIKYNVNIVYDYGNYYVNRKSFMNKYIIIQLGCYILISMIIAIMNVYCSKYSVMTNWYVLVDCIIMEMPIIIALKKGTVEVNS